MYAMLNYARLPRNLWGEAALTAAYLFNRTESRSLPASKTLYEMLHNVQPDLTHIHIFGACCFACIPTELQAKLGPKSREAYFMGYAPDGKAWCCRDKETGTFFNSHNVIFDETFSGRAFPTTDDDSDDEDATAPCPIPTTAPCPIPTSSAVPPLALLPAPPVEAHRSGRSRLPTEHGQLFQDQIASDRKRLARQWELRQVRIQGVPPEGVNAAPASPSHNATNLDPDAIVPDEEEVRYPRTLANLIATEFACITIRSDARRNPLTPGYNMKIPPATFDEAMQRSDRDCWLTAMQKEINLMSEMNVYKLVELPEGRRAIGC